MSFLSDKPFGMASQLAVAQSQIVPDNTLGNESSTVIPDDQIEGLPAELIEGGAQRGNNLFHSFSQFNVEVGRGAYFANPEGIANIFSRVTGADASEIMGRLGVQGNADLFLINPNGIIFGKNASLDVNGSFISTTADGIQFGEQGFFSATEPDAPPLLTVKPSAFFFNQMNSGRIENRSNAPAGFDFLETPLLGLRVPNGESFLLVGGEIVIDGGRLHALNGRVELLGIAGEGNIELNTNENNLTLTPASQLQSADISISNGAFINTSDQGGGEIILRGKNINIADKSWIFADTLGDLDGQGISIAAANLLLNNGSLLTTNVLGSGRGGNITIDTRTLNIGEGSEISTSILGQGDGGNINIDATETISIDRSGIFSEIGEGAIANGGDINLFTELLSLTSGSLISTNSFGQGNGGNINIDAKLFSAVEGASLNSNIVKGAIGQAGDITIKANDVVFDGGFARSRLEAGAEGSGGDIQITTGSLLVTGIPPELEGNTGQLVTATFGRGDAGNLTIDASGDVVFDGPGSDVFSLIAGNLDDPNIGPAEGNGGDITINSSSLLVTNQARLVGNVEGIGDAGKININTNSLSIINGGKLLNEVVDYGIGDAGDIEVVTETLNIINGGLLSTVSESSGNGGNINIDANQVKIENGVINTSASAGGGGGNISIKNPELLLLRNNSLISSTAGSLETGGNGGNINIDTDFLVTVPGENSDIIANAFQGNGGKIDIQAQGVFGIEERQATEGNITNDIDASSKFGLSGVVEIDVPDVDLSGENVKLTTQLTETEVAQVCEPGDFQGQSKFFVSGRSGLPDFPTAALEGNLGWEDWQIGELQITSSTSRMGREAMPSGLSPTSNEPPKIVEAQSWIINERGKVVLTADSTTNSSQELWHKAPQCQSNSEGVKSIYE